MKTSKEQMSEYLERLQQLQRQALGSIHCMSVDISMLYGKNATFTVWILPRKWNKDKTDTIRTKTIKHWYINEWHDEADNNKTMREIKKYMVKHQMIEE